MLLNSKPKHKEKYFGQTNEGESNHHCRKVVLILCKDFQYFNKKNIRTAFFIVIADFREIQITV
jgi:hypothetical protein